MALTRKMLRAMGIEDEKADEIIEAHAETVDALKQKAADAGRGGEDAVALRKQVEQLKADLAVERRDEIGPPFNVCDRV